MNTREMEREQRQAKRRSYFQQLQEYLEGQGYTVDCIRPLPGASLLSASSGFGYFLRYRDKQSVHLRCQQHYGGQQFVNNQIEAIDEWEAMTQAMRDYRDKQTVQQVWDAIRAVQS